MTTITKLHLNGSDYDIGLNSSNAGTTGQVLTKTAGGAEWANPSGGIENDTTGTTTTVTKIWAGTEAEYALITPVATTVYIVM